MATGGTTFRKMAKTPLRHVVVVIPGITGSVLQRDGKDVWAVSLQAGWHAAVSGGRRLKGLELRADGSDDGIRATALMPKAHLVPGLVRIDGYSRLLEMLEETFEIVRDGDGRELNLIPFPYDWRRDNRDAARRLGDTVEERLAAWRRHPQGASDAQVIVMGHSMGGLVARYWIECLGGWRSCRALITFGTPHRGSPNSIGYLANGYKKLWVDLTQAMRSFPSVHQLLPRYPALIVDGEARRVAETAGIPGVDVERALDGLRFHQEIEEAVARNDGEHSGSRYALLPFVGSRQPTIQSATLASGRVTISNDLPRASIRCSATATGRFRARPRSRSSCPRSTATRFRLSATAACKSTTPCWLTCVSAWCSCRSRALEKCARCRTPAVPRSPPRRSTSTTPMSQASLCASA